MGSLLSSIDPARQEERQKKKTNRIARVNYYHYVGTLINRLTSSLSSLSSLSSPKTLVNNDNQERVAVRTWFYFKLFMHDAA